MTPWMCDYIEQSSDAFLHPIGTESHKFDINQ